MTRFLMRVMVWNMRWMTRHVGFVARPIVRWYGANEIIACGLRDSEGRVGMIYTPRSGHRDHRVLVRKGRRWLATGFKTTGPFAGPVVLHFAAPGAQNGLRFKLQGTTTRGRQLSSPNITVKPHTVYDPTLLDISWTTTNPSVLFSWQGAERYDPMIYFLAVENACHTCTYAAIYTRETFWRYPETNRASYSVGPSRPAPLDPENRFIAKLLLVDYEGWVSHMAVRTFSV